MHIDMKKILIPILSALAVLTACNEDLLEIPQKNVITTETFYQTDEDAEAALVAVYENLITNICTSNWGIYNPVRSAYNLCGDDVYAAGSDFGDNDFMAALNEFRYDTSSEVLTKAYSGFYAVIYYCNLVINNFENGLPDGTKTAVTKRTVAEARTIRAYCYMMLAIGWGTPPHVLKPIGPYDFPDNYDGTQADLFKWWASECETAVADLDERESTSDKAGAVKVTKGFANAVAGKSYLFAGEYGSAKTALAKVISSGKYALVPGERLWENFHAQGDANEEKIFEANFQANGNFDWGTYAGHTTWMEANIWGWRSDRFVVSPNEPLTGIEGWGGLGVPKWFADAFVANDGTDSYRLNNTIISIEDAIYNTRYNLADVDALTVEQKKTSDKVGIKPAGLYGQSFYLALKQQPRVSDMWYPGANLRVNNYVFMRYAEVLLLYAEACLKSQDPTGALDAIKKIQTRAGSKTISTSVDMDVIEREKLFELWLEGSRWADMVRWGKFDRAAKAASAVPQMYDKLTRTPASSDTNVQWMYGSESNSRYYTVDTHKAKDSGYEVGFKSGKHELFPFPFQVTNVNKVITQNPGW